MAAVSVPASRGVGEGQGRRGSGMTSLWTFRHRTVVPFHFKHIVCQCVLRLNVCCEFEYFVPKVCSLLLTPCHLTPCHQVTWHHVTRVLSSIYFPHYTAFQRRRLSTLNRLYRYIHSCSHWFCMTVIFYLLPWSRKSGPHCAWSRRPSPNQLW